MQRLHSEDGMTNNIFIETCRDFLKFSLISLTDDVISRQLWNNIFDRGDQHVNYLTLTLVNTIRHFVDFNLSLLVYLNLKVISTTHNGSFFFLELCLSFFLKGQNFGFGLIFGLFQLLCFLLSCGINVFLGLFFGFKKTLDSFALGCHSVRQSKSDSKMG